MARRVALIFGIGYTAIGIAGFLAPLGGTIGMSPATLLGIAQVNFVHNVIHLIIGLLGLSAASDEARAAGFCQWMGLLLIALGVLGFFMPNPYSVVPIGGNDTWIHIITGAILAFVGFRSSAQARPRVA